MKKLFLILFSTFILFGCDEVEDSIVDPTGGDFNVTNIIEFLHLNVRKEKASQLTILTTTSRFIHKTD